MTEENTTGNTEAEDFLSAIQSGFDSVTEKEEAAPVEDAEEEAEQEAEEQEAEYVSEEEEEKPSKPIPKGKRAREEYEARIALERENARIKLENENYKRSLELINKPKEETKPKSDDDYLRDKGLDPDAFIDDAAKAALIITMKENDALKEAIKGTQATAADVAYDNSMIATFNSFEPELRADVGGAINHLIETDARALLIDYPNASIDEARAAAKESLNATMKQKYAAGVNPIEWAYQVAQARQYTPKLTAKQQAGKIDVKKVAESQNRAGSPNVAKVAVSSKGSDSLSADANYSKGIESIYG